MSNNVNAIQDGLNEEQKKAVRCVEGPVLIVAGAGSGKTRVLTGRIACILASGVPASRILALTFTKKAAGEMKERVAMMVGQGKARHLVMGTFHSVFVRFLRDYAASLGYPEHFTIYDTGDSVSAIKTCLKELELDDKVYKPKDVLSRISMAKNNLITVSGYRNNKDLQTADAYHKKPRIVDIYALYQEKMKNAGVMDFDDILVNMNLLLRDNRQALLEISDRFSYIMVDEYQDTNYAQYLILKKLAQFHHNICVVGDDSQSIYAFRGAKIENILNFKKDYPECKVFRLERNYRSTCNIVNAANSLIAHNAGRIPKECYAVGEDGELISLMHTYSEGEEAVGIVSDIMRRMREDSAQYQDFAVLYRTNSQSRAIEEQLRRRNVPYMVYSGNSFFERAEVKDVMAYFKLCVNVNDDESFKRIVNKPARAIGDTSVSALNECARAHQCSLFKAVNMPDAEVYGLRAAALQKLRVFCSMIDKLASLVRTTDAWELAKRIVDDTGIYAFYKSDTSIEGLARTSNVEELVNSVESFIEDRQEEMDEPDANVVFTLDDFVENVSLLSNVDVTTDEDTNNKVALMTVHSAKGLEFPYVYVAGMEENLFPSMNMLSSLQEIEEERRLFYVAITRAKKAVTLSFAATRMRNGKHESNAPSRFINEIDSKYIDNPLEDSGSDSLEVFEAGGFGGFGSRASGFSGGFRSGEPGGGRFGTSGGYRSGASGGSRSSDSDGSGGFGSRFMRNGSGLGVGSSRFGKSYAPGGYASSSKVTYEKKGSSRQPQSPVSSYVSSAASSAALSKRPELIDPNFVAVPMTELFEGERIEHNRFGAGTIKSITGSVPDMKAVIDFDDYGEKLLLLKYAKLRPFGK